jgi:hypothetical protein
MFKRRRFWVVLACCLALLVVALLGYHLWWYPRSPRGAFERIRLGMSEDEARAILAPLDDPGQPGDRIPVRAEHWSLKRGKVVYEGELQLAVFRFGRVGRHMRRATPLLGHEGTGMRFLNIGWPNRAIDITTRDGDITVELDDQRRVCAKTWLEYAPASTRPFERLRSWLP